MREFPDKGLNPHHVGRRIITTGPPGSPHLCNNFNGGGTTILGFPGGSADEDSACKAGDSRNEDSIPGLGRS